MVGVTLGCVELSCDGKEPLTYEKDSPLNEVLEFATTKFGAGSFKYEKDGRSFNATTASNVPGGTYKWQLSAPAAGQETALRIHKAACEAYDSNSCSDDVMFSSPSVNLEGCAHFADWARNAGWQLYFLVDRSLDHDRATTWSPTNIRDTVLVTLRHMCVKQVLMQAASAASFSARQAGKSEWEDCLYMRMDGGLTEISFGSYAAHKESEQLFLAPSNRLKWASSTQVDWGFHWVLREKEIPAGEPLAMQLGEGVTRAAKKAKLAGTGQAGAQPQADAERIFWRFGAIAQNLAFLDIYDF
ncbi:hypothetical protein WJX72_009244 [[Myrmecia] bisecta]|uniref:Uncharacterized protein n=1 Tax=[Myrmecia] bisecta TaxID=41462 RepID=A0AAW1QS52_9CHLO